MSDAWEEIQALKSKRNSLRERLKKRREEREGILNLSSGATASASAPLEAVPLTLNTEGASSSVSSPATAAANTDEPQEPPAEIKIDPEIEKWLLKCLCEVAISLPTDSQQLAKTLGKALDQHVPHEAVVNLLQKFAAQELISFKESREDGKGMLVITHAEHSKLVDVVNEWSGEKKKEEDKEEENRKRKGEADHEDDSAAKVAHVEKEEKKRDQKEGKDHDIMSLLSLQTTREKENKKLGEEILDLLSKPTAKERSIAERFRSQGGAQVQEFCPHGTKIECTKVSGTVEPCKKLHFKKIIQKHTDESLGDCSFLNTCFHMDTCKYVHYEVDSSAVPYNKDVIPKFENKENTLTRGPKREPTILFPAQWIQCDLRYFDMSVLGKFAVIMADPPWDIHMELPYGTMSDDEMRQLGIPCLQDDGLIFLWVTGRAMELGRECLQLWGYERCDELIWVKTNQLQRIIRTGRTGHWLNHGKEHCLVGRKGSPKDLNCGLDCDVIVAEVRATSHKPDEIYGIIERLSPSQRKIELFGRPHNVQPNWVTLGNQVDGVRLLDPELVENFRKRYPDGNCMVPPKT